MENLHPLRFRKGVASRLSPSDRWLYCINGSLPVARLPSLPHLFFRFGVVFSISSQVRASLSPVASMRAATATTLLYATKNRQSLKTWRLAWQLLLPHMYHPCLTELY